MRETLVLIAALIIQASSLAYSIPKLSPTKDEAAHLAAGIEYWRTGRADLYNVNPPLVRLWATWPIAFFTEISVPRLKRFSDATDRTEFVRGGMLRDELGKDFMSYLVFARIMCIPIVLVGTLGVFCLATSLFNQTAGVIAACLWALNPIVIGYGSLLTCDIAAGSAGVWAVYAGLLATRKSSFKNVLVAGIMLGLAILTKSIWLVAFVAWPVGAVLLLHCRLRKANKECPAIPFTHRSKIWLRAFASLTLLLFIAWIVILFGYRSRDTFKPLRDYTFVSQNLKGVAKEPFGNRFSDSAMGMLPMPLPSSLVRGVDLQWKDFDVPLDCYLFGEWQRGGWLYYYAVALAVKLPLGLMVLFFVSAGCWLRNAEALICCLGLTLLVFVLVSLKTNMNEHTRYLWSILPFICVLASGVAVSFKAGRGEQEKPSFDRRIVPALICTCWVAGAGLATLPFGLSYSNVIVGGAKHTWKVLAGSNVDWDHGWIAARDWLHSRSSSTMPIAIVEPHAGYFDSIRLRTSSTFPDDLQRVDETKKLTILISTENRMSLDRLQNSRYSWSDRRHERIGCCIEAYALSLSEVQEIPNLRWFIPPARQANGINAPLRSHYSRLSPRGE